MNELIFFLLLLFLRELCLIENIDDLLSCNLVVLIQIIECAITTSTAMKTREGIIRATATNVAL